jgi:hypothetical protein
MPVTRPEAEPTVATDDVPELQVPPPASLNVVVAAAQIGVVPVIAEGRPFTVTDAVTKQLAPEVKVIVVVPVATPATIPEDEPTVATVVALLLQVPPAASLSVMVEPTHTAPGPAIADGTALTVIRLVSRQPVLATW